MTNRQLFVAAFGGKATERVPVHEQGIASDVASKILGREAFTGARMLHYQEAVWAVRGPEAHREFQERLVQDVVELYRTLRFGAICAPWLMGAPTRQVGEYEFLYGDPDGDWYVCRYDPQAHTYGVVEYSRPPAWRGEEAIRAAADNLEAAAANWRTNGSAEALESHVRRWLDIAGDEFELLATGAMLSVPINEEWLTACALCPDQVGRYLDAQVEIGIQQIELQASLGLRIIWGGGDLADKNGPVYGPKFFREVVLPRYVRLVKAAEDHGMKYLFRSDGNLWSIADDLFVTAGAHGFGEIDHDAGMDLHELMKRYPKLTCWGNVSCRLLRTGTPAEVRSVAEELVQLGKATGRLILGSSNTVLPGTPPENYLAMWEAAQ
ncbi:MAG: hypothetical protein N2512_01140 [Armatimonadetes bacterium]|nr:hypothetical protein [Armatimonadota bacterium]